MNAHFVRLCPRSNHNPVAEQLLQPGHSSSQHWWHVMLASSSQRYMAYLAPPPHTPSRRRDCSAIGNMFAHMSKVHILLHLLNVRVISDTCIQRFAAESRRSCRRCSPGRVQHRCQHGTCEEGSSPRTLLCE